MIAKRITPTKTMGNASQQSICARRANRADSSGAPYGLRNDELWRVVFFTLLAGCLFAAPFAATPAAAQASTLDKGPAPPYEEAAPAPAEPAKPVFDPLHASKAVEVGEFYMKRGNYDAAIERFQDATHFQPSLARPYFLLGEAYERKGELDHALANYRKYLEVYRTAPDREKILKRIEKLESQTAHTQAKKSG